MRPSAVSVGGAQQGSRWCPPPADLRGLHASASSETRPTPVTRANATAPATTHVTNYPMVKTLGNSSDRFWVMREYRATVGATDGTSSLPHHDQDTEEPADRSQTGPASIAHTSHLPGSPPPADADKRKHHNDHGQPTPASRRTPGPGSRSATGARQLFFTRCC